MQHHLPVLPIRLSAGDRDRNSGRDTGRDFYLCEGRAAIFQEAHTAEDAFEVVASGRAVVLVLMSEGNMDLYRRDDVICRPTAPAVQPDEPCRSFSRLMRRAVDTCCRAISAQKCSPSLSPLPT